MADIVLALDIGTSFVKAAAFELSAHPAGGLRSQAPYPSNPDGGQLPGVQDPDDVLGASCDAIESVLRAAHAHDHRVAAVGVCTFWHTMLGVDAEGRAI